MTRPSPFRLAAVLSLALLGLFGVGCKQGLGGRCEQASDCESGFCRGTIGPSASGGRCATPGTVEDAGAPSGGGDDASADTGTDDAAVTGDGATPDDGAAPGDGATPDDAGPGDADTD